MKKIKAYSFIELMVVMVIGTITIAIAYQGYILFYKQFLSFRNGAEKNATIIQLDALMVNDFNNSKEVRRTSEGIICSSKDRNVNYVWTDNYVLRKQAVSIDTFPMTVKELKISLSSKESQIGDLVDEVYFIGNDNLYFPIEKRYGADVLINSEFKTK